MQEYVILRGGFPFLVIVSENEGIKYTINIYQSYNYLLFRFLLNYSIKSVNEEIIVNQYKAVT